MPTGKPMSPSWLRAPHQLSLGRVEELDREHLIITLKTTNAANARPPQQKSDFFSSTHGRYDEPTSADDSPLMTQDPAHESFERDSFERDSENYHNGSNYISNSQLGNPMGDARSVRYFVPPKAQGTTYEDAAKRKRVPPKSLSLFSRHATLRVPRRRLRESPYFAGLLDGDWKNLGSVELEFAQNRLLDAYMAALLCVVDPQFSLLDHNWDRSTELLVISSAAMFGCSSLQERAEQLALAHLCERSVIPVVRLAERLGRFELKRGVFRWLCQTGILASESLLNERFVLISSNDMLFLLVCMCRCHAGLRFALIYVVCPRESTLAMQMANDAFEVVLL
jgi:hypothetical protein